MSIDTKPLPPPLTKRMALFQDFDGSLVELASEPEAVVLKPGLGELLQTVQRQLDGALALVSGRRLDDLDQHFPGCAFAGAGVHGAELRRRPQAAIEQMAQSATQSVVAALHRHFSADPRILIEDKKLSVALHYRLAPERREECERFIQGLAMAEGLAVQAGKMVLELLPPGSDKGQAVRRLMDQAPFAGRLPVFVGDDAADEHGMAAVQLLGGFGVKVGAGLSIAQYRLPTVDAVHHWLAGQVPPTSIHPSE